MRLIRTIVLAPLFAAGIAAAQPQPIPLPPVRIPPENPITEPKRVLGKALFFDEQLSTDGTVACATCHTLNQNGSDPRRARNAGADGLLNTPDDVQASPGVIRSDALSNYLRDSIYGAGRQVTSRAANSPINAALNPAQFWDGRATTQFIDPVTGAVAIAADGSLESQIVNPPMSGVEMGHDSISWTDVVGKLAIARPLGLASNLPADLAAGLAGQPGYPELFRRAFGDTTITATRIAFAIATYERTLIANQTPYDTNSLTPNQQQGLNRMGAQRCTVCHVPPTFTDPGLVYRNIGLRPPTEDAGRRTVTGNANDRGKFKVPSLRNVALQQTFMHNGQFTTLQQVFGFYDRAPGTQQFPDNQDPVMNQVRLPPPDGALVQDFLTNGLTDPRVRNAAFPFDRPTLFTQRPGDQSTPLGGGSPGSGGIIPQIIAVCPSMIGNMEFRIGLDRALGGATARLAISTTPPVNGQVTPTWTFQNDLAAGSGNGAGLATHHWPLIGAGVVAGQTIYAQWIVNDPAAFGGQSLSSIASFRFFCPTGGCAAACAADLTGDGQVGVEDLFTFLGAYFSSDIRADINNSGSISVQDIFDFLSAYFAGCAQ